MIIGGLTALTILILIIIAYACIAVASDADDWEERFWDDHD